MGRPIKVVHVLNSVGGVDTSIRLVTENVNPEKIENIIVHGNADTRLLFRDKYGNPLKEYKLPIQREINLLKDLRSIFQTVKILRTEQPNVVHAHSSKGGMIARIASLFYPVTVLHTPQAYSFLSERRGLKRCVFLHFERLLKHCNSVLIASSMSEQKRGIKEVGYKADKVSLFNNSILPIKTVFDKKRFPKELNLPNTYVCTVGRPSFQKNIEMMVRAMEVVNRESPSIHLVLMGVGEYSPYKEKVRKLVNTLGLDRNITMLDWMEREDVLRIIANSKFYISTARYEGLPFSIIESMALGKASIVTDVDGNRDLVQQGYNGYVVQEGEILEMADKIIELYHDDLLRKRFEKNALKCFKEKFDIKNNILILESIYEEHSKRSRMPQPFLPIE